MIRKEIRDGGGGVERGLRWKHKVTELTIEEEDKEYLHLPLLVSSRQSSRLDSVVKRCSSEVLKLSFQRGCSVKGLALRD